MAGQGDSHPGNNPGTQGRRFGIADAGLAARGQGVEEKARKMAERREEEEGVRSQTWPSLPFGKDQTWVKKASRAFDQHPSVSSMKQSTGGTWGIVDRTLTLASQILQNVLPLQDHSSQCGGLNLSVRAVLITPTTGPTSYPEPGQWLLFGFCLPWGSSRHFFFSFFIGA